MDHKLRPAQYRISGLRHGETSIAFQVPHSSLVVRDWGGMRIQDQNGYFQIIGVRGHLQADSSRVTNIKHTIKYLSEQLTRSCKEVPNLCGDSVEILSSPSIKELLTELSSKEYLLRKALKELDDTKSLIQLALEKNLREVQRLLR